MTAIDDKELSVDSSLPDELYKFIGSYKNYYLTSSPVPITFQGQTYQPIVGLKRSNVKAGTNTEDKITVKITMPIQSELIVDYGFQITPPKLDCTIYRIYKDLTPYDSNFRIYWEGPVSSISIQDTDATVSIPSIFSNALSGACPSIYYQTPCNFVLFDNDTCGVSRVANSVSTTIVEISADGLTIRLASLGAFLADEFVAGEILVPSQSERRMILEGNLGTGALSVNYAFGRLQVGDTVQATRGCDHAWKGDCKNRYANTSRFGGHPLIPSINLFESGF